MASEPLRRGDFRLGKKKSEGAMRWRARKGVDETMSTSDMAPLLRGSSESTWEELREYELRKRSFVDHAGGDYQHYSTSKTPLKYGQYESSTSTEHSLPELPAQAVSVPGARLPARVPRDPLVRSNELLPLIDFLREGPPPATTRRPTSTDQPAWENQDMRGLIETQAADHDHIMPSVGLNSRIATHHDRRNAPQKVESGRIESGVPQQSEPRSFPQIPWAKSARSPPLLDRPASSRNCPPILPIRRMKPSANKTCWGSPFGELTSFQETTEERAVRPVLTENLRASRRPSDRYLELQRQIGNFPIVKQKSKEQKRDEEANTNLSAGPPSLQPLRISSPQNIRSLSQETDRQGLVTAEFQPSKEEVLPEISALPILSTPDPGKGDADTIESTHRSSENSVALRAAEKLSRNCSEPIPSIATPGVNRGPKKIDQSRLAAFDIGNAVSQPETTSANLARSRAATSKSPRTGDIVSAKLALLHEKTGSSIVTAPRVQARQLRRASSPSKTCLSKGVPSLQTYKTTLPAPDPEHTKKSVTRLVRRRTESDNDSAIEPLPSAEQDGRYHQWDQALQSTKKTPKKSQLSPPPTQLQPVCREVTTLWIPPQALDTSPIRDLTTKEAQPSCRPKLLTPAPTTTLWVPPHTPDIPLVQESLENPFNISDLPSQRKPSKCLPRDRESDSKARKTPSREHSVSGNSNHSCSSLPGDEIECFAAQRAIAESSHGSGYSKRGLNEQDSENNLTGDDSKLAADAECCSSPFDDADEGRLKAWNETQKSLTRSGGEDLRQSFNLEKLFELLPHLAPDGGTSPRPDEDIPYREEDDPPQRPEMSTPQNLESVTPRSKDGRVICQAVSIYSPCPPPKKLLSAEVLNRNTELGGKHDQPNSLPQASLGCSESRKDHFQNISGNGKRGQNEEDPPPVPARSPLRSQKAVNQQKGPFGISGLRKISPSNALTTAGATPGVFTQTRSNIPPSRDNAAPPSAVKPYEYQPSTSLYSPAHGSPPLQPLPFAPLPLTQIQPVAEPAKKNLSLKSLVSFLGDSLPASENRPAKMETQLQVRPSEFSSVKTKAVEDARQMQATVIEEANKAGKIPPKYALLELIGKGSFGRVYKGKDMTSAAIVAVKIIDIDESDTLNPRLADSYSEFLKEVNALKILSESNARNINHVIEALPVGKSMWMITEHCGGGSIATLMRPTAPGGLQERWVVPILREVAEAIKWVHQAGIIHRDIKCANVLITEDGGVQLCDFGVAGIIEHKLDKRSTVIGTPHWMAPELFDATPSYGKEVDIWAFGSMVFEIATGLPPNVANGISFERLGPHLKQHVPRLEGGSYSNNLRDLVAFCLEEQPSARPTIEKVQRHPYIYNTESKYPASDLAALVRAFKIWEDHGGSRKSLFMLGGAQGPSELSSSVADDEWNFSTTAAFDQEYLRNSTPADVFDAYGNGVSLDGFFTEDTTRPQKASRRRPPPEALNRLPAPLEKIFDPNTMSNYDDNSRNHYGRMMQQPISDLPLRDDTAHTSIRDTMIDLGGHDSDTGLSNFPDMDTIKAARRGGSRDETDGEYASTLHNFSRPALSDPADVNPNRRTKDWKFPSMAPPASAEPEISRFPNNYDLPRPTFTPGSSGPGGRPALVHHPTEPVGAPFAGSLLMLQPSLERLSMRESLIDLDMSLPEPISTFIPNFAPTTTRPSTANSDTGSATSEHIMSGNPFELERHASLYAPLSEESTGVTDPDYYLAEESAVPARLRSNSTIRDINEVSDFSASDVESGQDHFTDGRYDTYSDSDMPPPPLPAQAPFPRPANQPYTMNHIPDLPKPPSERALSGLATHNEIKDDFSRMLSGFTSQLEAFRDIYGSAQVVSRKGPTPQRQDRKDGAGASTGTSA